MRYMHTQLTCSCLSCSLSPDARALWTCQRASYHPSASLSPAREPLARYVLKSRSVVAPSNLDASHSQGVSSPTSSTTPRRKRSSRALRQLARARPCKTQDCPIVRSGPSIFDAVPWASALQADPAPELLQPWNIGDLSMLTAAREPRTRTGPIRSRKSSLRSAPFPDFAEITPELTPARVGALDCSPPLDLPFMSLCGRRLAFDDVPRTPPPLASRLPVDAGFRNLMPIAFADL